MNQFGRDKLLLEGTGAVPKFDSDFRLAHDYNSQRSLVLERMSEANDRLRRLLDVVDEGRWWNVTDLSEAEMFNIGVQAVQIISSIEAVERVTLHVGNGVQCRS